MKKPSVFSPDLLRDFNLQPRQHRNVLISCVGDLEQTKIELEKKGIDIKGQMIELEILKASIDLNDLLILQNTDNIEWIEIDEEVQINQDP